MRNSRAFTLIELLAVMGLMALMAGGLGLALREGSPGAGLAPAQAMVGSLLAAAREQAVGAQNRAIVIADADPGDERFLRRMSVAVETAPDSGNWRVADDGVVLPRGIFIVPGSELPPGVSLGATDGPAATWPAGRRSSLVMLPGSRVTNASSNPPAMYLGLAVPLTSLGLAGGGGGDKLVLAVGRRTPSGVALESPEQVRGVVLSAYGVAIFINDGAGFDF